MFTTSIENVLDFVYDFNALIRVHQHSVNQQLDGQRVRIGNRVGCFLAAILSRLLANTAA